MDHAYNEYKDWKEETYTATVEEWESWAERIIQAFETEMNAGKKDFDLISRLQVENGQLKAARDALVRCLDGLPEFLRECSIAIQHHSSVPCDPAKVAAEIEATRKEVSEL